MKDGKCVVFDDKKEISQIDLEHISNDFYVSNDILYVYLDEHIYAYNSNLEEISVYDTGIVLGHRDFIVVGDYIYYLGFVSGKMDNAYFKYSTKTFTKELLKWDGQYPAVFTSENIYFYDYFSTFDDNIICFDSAFSRVFYNKNHKKIKMMKKSEDSKNYNVLEINGKSFVFEYSFWMGDKMYLDTENVVFFTYNPDTENCSEYIKPCISQLKDVKLWKYNIETEQLSLIKQFNDYTILISFDENNYHYYYDGKFYSNDIEVEDAPKIEVGDIFTYYTSKDPNLYCEEIQKSFTKLAYISGKFYYIHKEINSDLDEFHG